MALKYEWKNVETGEAVDHDSPSVPPDDSGDWIRVFAFGVSKVEGGGGSKSRSSIRKES